MSAEDEIESKWQKRFERERVARRESENLLEQKSLELYQANKRLEKQVEEKGSRLAVEEERFSAIFEASMDGIILLDERTRIVEINHTAESMLGLPRDRLVGHGVARLISPENWQLARNSFRQVRDTGYCRYEANLIRADGSLIPTEIVGSRAKIGNTLLIQGILRDISERRGAYLKLQQAQIEAEKANEAKSLFLATMSHEIRTPLNGIIGFTDLVLGSKLSSEQRQNLAMVQRSGDILLHIINDILDFSRIESGKLELEEVDYELRDCVEEVLDLHAQTASSKSIELLYEIAPELPTTLRGDITRLRQVLMNLISNALKFTSSGTITVLATLEDQSVRVSVTDTGVGFNPALAETLFEPFNQEDASTTRKYGGTGLGLAICRKLLERMGGEISASSEIGKGAQFTFSFPLQEGETTDPEIDPTTYFQGKRALLVDDVEPNLIFLSKRLGQWGFSVETTASGAEAIQRVSDQDFDIVLSDMCMPEMDGIELATQLRKLTTAPFVLVTSSRLSGDKERAYDVGYSKVLFKPLRQRELLKTLRDILVGKPKSTPASGASTKSDNSPAPLQEKPLVLVAEDNTINARLAALILERLNYRCQVAVNGKEAIEMLREGRDFQLILMDMRMPEMDGLEATRGIRNGDAGDNYREIPIVAVTANALKSDEKACLEAGMTSYLTKPLRPDEVKKTLTELLPTT